MNHKGFVPDKDTGKVIMHPTAQAAMKFMKPGEQLVPIRDDEELEEYKDGRLRMPSMNRANLR